MPVNITEEMYNTFMNNGFTEDDIQYTVNYHRSRGQSDDEIFNNLNNKYKSLINTQDAPKQPERPRNFNIPDYQGVLNDTSLSSAQKAEKIKQLGADFNKQQDKDTKDYIRKQRLGAALEIGSAAIPLGGGLKIASKIASPLLKEAVRIAPGLAASGGLYGIGNTMINKNDASIKDFAKGTAAGAAGNLAGGIGFMAAMKAGKPLINLQAVKRVLPKTLEALTSVPAEYSERALNKELAGQSILKGKFDKKTAYRPVEEKLTEARNRLADRTDDIKNQYKQLGAEVKNKYNTETRPESWYKEQYANIAADAAKKYEQKIKPESYFDKEYGKLKDNALNALEEERIKRAQAVNEALNNLPENIKFKAADLRNDIKNITDSYSLSGNPELNYGANAAQGKIDKIEDLLYGNGKSRYGEYVQSIKDLEFPKNYLETIKGRYKNQFHTKTLENLNNDIVFAERNFNKNILDKLRKEPEILQNPEKLAELEKQIGDYAHFADDELNQVFYDKFFEAVNKGQILERGQNYVNPKELYDINQNISKNMVNWDKAGENTANGVLEQIYGRYSNRLNDLSPELAAANNAYSSLMDAEKAIGGIRPETFGTKLRDYQSGGQLRSGMSEALDNLNSLLPAEHRFLPHVNALQEEYAVQKFLQDNINKGALRKITDFDNLPLNEQNILNSIAPEEINAYKNLSLQQGIENNLYNNINGSFNDISKYERLPLEKQAALEQFAPEQLAEYRNLLDEQNHINNTLNKIGSAYERNPRLLANRTDLGFEQALDDLQNRSGINFMENLNDIRAREALEKWFPGQGGGSGSEQGFGNLFRTALIGGAPTAAIIARNPAALLGLASVSPKFTAKGTIQNLGRLSRAADFTNNLYDYILSTPLNAEITAARKLRGN